MAQKCPVCNRRLTLLDWKQNCPGCGTNLMFHGFKEQFYEDAKYSELGRAKVRVWWAKVMSCFFGSKLQIIRLIFILLPPAALLIPMCTFTTALPLCNFDINVSILGAIPALSDGTLNALMTLRGAEVMGQAITMLGNVFTAFAGALVAGVLIIVCELFCFLSAKVMSALLSAFSLIGAGFAVYGIFAVNTLTGSVQDFGNIFSASGGFGHFAALAAFTAVFIPNIILAVRGFEIKYKDGDLYRISVAKKLKHGEITLAEISLPVFETPAEREERIKIIEDTVNGISPEDEKQKEGAHK